MILNFKVKNQHNLYKVPESSVYRSLIAHKCAILVKVIVPFKITVTTRSGVVEVFCLTDRSYVRGTSVLSRDRMHGGVEILLWTVHYIRVTQNNSFNNLLEFSGLYSLINSLNPLLL